MTTKHKVDNKKIIVRLDTGFVFGNGFEAFVRNGFKKWYTKWIFRSKAWRNIIWVWCLDEEETLLNKFIKWFS